MPLEETLRALDDLVTAGKVRYIGTSNHKAWQLADANWTSQLHGLVTYASVQHRYTILYRAVACASVGGIEDEVVPACASLGIAILPWNPLAGGLLTHAYANRRMPEGNRFDLPGGRGEMYRQRYWNDDTLDEVDRILAVAMRHGHSLTHVALQWVANRPGVTSLLISAETPEQLRDTMCARER